MEINISNFNAIETASVKLDGLTVIAGENDTGKSTVGKLIFSIIKSMSKYSQDFDLEKGIQIEKEVEQLWRTIRTSKVFKLKDTNKGYYEKIRELFFPPNILKQLGLFIANAEVHPIEMERYIADKQQQVIDYVDDDIVQKKSLEILDRINQVLIEEENISNLIQEALQRALYSEFYGDIMPAAAKFSIKEGELDLLHAKIIEGKVQEFELIDEYIPFEDVTFVESPMFLQLSSVIRDATTLFEDKDAKHEGLYRPTRSIVSLHIKDLMGKLEDSRRFSQQPSIFDSNENLKLQRSISQTIRGSFFFDKREGDFFFKQDKESIRSVNTASGVKAFGMIQLLLQAEALNDQSLLIIDEPETHLHPKWQIEYAKVIVSLVKEGVPVLVTSHSPYLIQALIHYGKEYDISQQSNFYLSERQGKDNKAIITEVTHDMNKVFQKLSQPLTELVWK